MVIWWIWVVLSSVEGPSDYPDIDAAWKEAMTALAQAGLGLPDKPLFLVVGRVETSEQNLVEAAKLDWKVQPTPPGKQAPLHVFADSDSIYVSCAGISALGRLAGILALEELPQSADGDVADAVIDDITKTIIPNKKESELIEELQEGGEVATTLARRRARRSMNKAMGPNFLADSREVERIKGRLKYLCRLISRDRQPYCPINGLLLLLPLGCSDTKAEATQTEQACQLDLGTIRSSFKMDCPVFAMVCDMEVLPGFVEFMRRQDAKKLLGRVGQRFCLASNMTGNQLQDQGREAIRWMCTSYLQQSVYPKFKTESADGADRDTVVAGNTSLFLFLDEMRDRTERLAGILAPFIASEAGNGWMFGGCYMAATGAQGQQGFVHGVVKRLAENQDCVTWTPQAQTDDANAHAQARFGCFLILLAWLGMGWVLWLKFF
jgi:hypothetical protein